MDKYTDNLALWSLGKFSDKLAIMAPLYLFQTSWNWPPKQPSQASSISRSLSARIQNTLSSQQLIRNGEPREEVWSVSLFLIAIDELTNCVYFPLTHRPFADDFSVSLSTSNHQRAARLLQTTLDRISTWSSARGFCFSDTKEPR